MGSVKKEVSHFEISIVTTLHQPNEVGSLPFMGNTQRNVDCKIREIQTTESEKYKIAPNKLGWPPAPHGQ